MPFWLEGVTSRSAVTPRSRTSTNVVRSDAAKTEAALTSATPIMSAEAVAAELARQGISRNEMSIQAFGESRPLVPTADNVREPQNRRVEIVLR